MSEIVQVGNSVLRQVARALTREEIKTEWFENLVDDMVKSMYAAPGVGLAAPQLGVPVRVIVLEDRTELISAVAPDLVQKQGRVVFPLKVIVNPTLEIIGDRKAKFNEGCLSVSGFCAEVERFHEVRVTGLDRTGAEFSWQVTGWPARILQHEVDHINGTLYIDKMDTRTFATRPIKEFAPAHPDRPPNVQ
eukprot:Phypoly_transcript_21772.p1 GENE.Phypoly_transcript_21772~~Phypoly_transcript_21772.p1  ORF type:complete len:207 (+),score=32.13 Phypoly_transcript_21772:50-622(+)